MGTSLFSGAGVAAQQWLQIQASLCSRELERKDPCSPRNSGSHPSHGHRPRHCCNLAGCAHTRGSTDMLAPCHLSPLPTLGTEEHRREAKVGLRVAWHWAADALGTNSLGFRNSSRKQTGSRVERGGSPVQPHLQVRKGLKPGD